MSRKLLGKVMAGAGLGAASLLICAPGTALADGAPHDRGNRGHIHTVPKGVKPGHKFKIILKCEHPVARAWVSSKITGKIWLKPVPEDGLRVPETPRPQPDGGGQPDGGQPPISPQPEPPNPQPEPPANTQPPLPPENTQPPLPDAQPDMEGQPGGEGGQAAYGGAVYAAWAKVPHWTRPGHYPAWGACDSKGKIVVLPRGWVHGGDGGATGSDSGKTAAGASLLGAAALGGFLMIRRRRTDGSPA
ncbi:hypothetical protein O7626_27055 [Micromonospora sp. WMMD1102]|uniref:hypothetical protein n=1 Tax=Micromonospora sp. WMMD1102 TaxID=3016105 RepID=UPI0024151727|nr:hypothetical protein [Micromonospora sp. WMMD1102]MDG4789538.1 hypothetical protein [Micromonospora sp. WMMD1102]